MVKKSGICKLTKVNSGFYCVIRLVAFLLPLYGMLVHYKVYFKYASTHLYTWVDKGTVRVKCLAQEHTPNTSPWRGLEVAALAHKSRGHSSVQWQKQIQIQYQNINPAARPSRDISSLATAIAKV